MGHEVGTPHLRRETVNPQLHHVPHGDDKGGHAECVQNLQHPAAEQAFSPRVAGRNPEHDRRTPTPKSAAGKKDNELLGRSVGVNDFR